MTAPSKFAPTPIRWVFNEDANAEPLANRGGGLSGLLRLTSCVAGAGATLPPEFTALRDRFTGFCTEAAGGANVLFDKLSDALLSGHDDAWIWFGACVSQAGAGAVEQRAEALARLHGVAEGALRGLYAPIARPVYAGLAHKFDTAADAFAGAASIIDPAADPGEVVNAGQRTLQAWRAAATLAAELDSLLEPLCAASELLRGPHQPSGLGTSRDAYLLALVADTTGLHARQVWHAFRDWPEPRPVSPGESIQAMTAAPTNQPVGSRCGRWGRLLAVGAALRAHPDPAQLVLFGQPQPVGVKPVAARNKAQLVRFDPEGDLPAEAPPKRRLRDLFRRPDEAPAEPNIFDTILLTDDEGR